VLYFAILGAVKSLMFQVFSKHTNSHKLQKNRVATVPGGQAPFTVYCSEHFTFSLDIQKKEKR
jgi:hypothetical protein